MKRTFDFFSSLTILVVFSPIIFVLVILVLIKLGFPVLFKQLRPGLNGKPFYMLKFRSMMDEIDKDGRLLPDEQRLTSFGKLLRSTSLDEIPGLWNVVKGDMSLVGPRPLLMEYLSLYSAEQARRHEVRPGITGWAQVSGRNALSWEEKFNLDIWYVNNRSFWLDLKILFLTVYKVLVREGISADGHMTMEKFKGNNLS